MNSSDFATPMMKQYQEIKKQYPDCILFFRLGDFYEMFENDAKIGSQVLGITLTARNKGKDGKIPMAGVPYHAVDSYLGRLVKAGHKVAICEQTSTPDGKGIVEREVTRVVTPGTVLDERNLSKKENNYLVSITFQNNILGLAFADISTGEFVVHEINLKKQPENIYQILGDEISRLHPAECILPETLYGNFQIVKTLKKNDRLNIYCFYDWDVFADNARDILKKHFGVTTLKGFDIDDKPQALKAAAALLGYLKFTQKDRVSQLTSIKNYNPTEFVALDRSTILNLELFTTIRDHEKKGTLIYHLDHTQTAMGARLLRNWLLHPLRDVQKIQNRLDSVEFLLKNSRVYNEVNELLTQVLDIERIVSRLASGLANARDLIGLKISIEKVLQITKVLKDNPLPVKLTFTKHIDQISAIFKLLHISIIEDPPHDTKQGGIIKPQVDTTLDNLRNSISGNQEWLSNLEKKERERTKINSLKVRFNQVFGFYIEISHANRDKVPADYIRKQTLVNSERYETIELKQHEELVLTAQEKINLREYELFQNTIQKILDDAHLLQQTAKDIAAIDVLVNFASLAKKNNYVKPEFSQEKEINVVEGRHPVVEKLLEDEPFVPNDVTLNSEAQLLLITGPNMGGKSVFIRSLAQIVILAHIGCFVPAKSAFVLPVDRIFVRSGAADMMAIGLSTFMVEMIETAAILNHATNNSLVILDEIGRGTSTYDGVSLAWAVAEYLVSHPKNNPLTLFATHYHELQTLADTYPKIKNFQAAVEQTKNELIFLHKILPGGTSHSYGIAAAKLAGVPQDVIFRALEVLKKLEKLPLQTPHHKIAVSDFEQMSFLKEQKHPVLDELKKIDPNILTPIDALKKLAELKQKIN